MNRIELLMRRRNVAAFIDADPVDVVFSRSTKIRTPAGGWVEGPRTPLPSPQRVRIIDSVRRFADTQVNTEAGNITLTAKVLIGFHDMDIKVGDDFTWNNAQWEVKAIKDDREERTVAAIDYYGKLP